MPIFDVNLQTFNIMISTIKYTEFYLTTSYCEKVNFKFEYFT